MLDLQARVHLEKVEIARPIDDELDGSGAGVADGASKFAGLLAHRPAGVGVEERRRRLLDDLLIPALDRAFTLTQVDAVAVLVGENLDLDVPRLRDELLDEDAVVPEARLGFAAGRTKALARLMLRPGNAHALAATTGAGLDHDRKADLAGNLRRFVFVGDQAHVTRHGRDAGLRRQLLRGDLVAHGLDRRRRRADEDQALGLQRLGEGPVLGEKTVAGVDGLRSRLPDRVEDVVDDDVGLVRRRGADANGLVRHPYMRGVLVCVGVHGDGAKAHPPRRADHAARDLAPVCNQDFLEHPGLLPWTAGSARATHRPDPATHLHGSWLMDLHSTRLSPERLAKSWVRGAKPRGPSLHVRQIPHSQPPKDSRFRRGLQARLHHGGPRGGDGGSKLEHPSRRRGEGVTSFFK